MTIWHWVALVGIPGLLIVLGLWPLPTDRPDGKNTPTDEEDK